MILFEQLWQALYEHGASAKKEEGTRRFWAELSAEQQGRASTIITQRLNEGKFVQYDPIRAIKEALRQHGSENGQLSFEEYYAKFGTTEEQGGWKRRFLPEQHKTIYIKQ